MDPGGGMYSPRMMMDNPRQPTSPRLPPVRGSFHSSSRLSDSSTWMANSHFMILGEQLKQASRAFEACLARHSIERRQLEGQVSSLMTQLQALSVGTTFPAPSRCTSPFDAHMDESACPVQPPPALQMRTFLAAPDPAEEQRPQGLRLAELPKVDVPAPKVEQPSRKPSKQLSSMQSETSLHSAKPVVSLGVVSERNSDISESGSLIAVPISVVRQRLLARLGHMHDDCLVTGLDLYQAASALGLERYSLREMESLVQKLAVVVNLQFRPAEKQVVPYLGKQLSKLSSTSFSVTSELLGSAGLGKHTASEMATLASQADWIWPDVTDHSDWNWPDLGVVNEPASWRGSSRNSHHSSSEDHHTKMVPLKVLVKAMTVDDVTLKKLLGSALCEQLFAIKEVLVTGDANRLVSELACVRIDDLATRRPEPEWFIFEPLVGLLVVANAITIAFQIDGHFEDWHGWLLVEVLFTVAFFLEMLLRHLWYGVRNFWYGPDTLWNLFDIALLGVGIGECVLTAVVPEDAPSPAIVRVVRLLKLTRLVRIFRMRAMLELQLMIKGLLGGFRTLFWAIILLLFVLYVLGVLTYWAFSNHREESIRQLFEDVPSAMFMTFRCVSGDCFTAKGTSIISTLQLEYGAGFVCCVFLAYMFITLGLFNVILAIYVETTMTAAKQTVLRHDRESIRIAHITKRLLKLFCAAEETFNRKVTDGMPVSLDMKKLMLAADLNNTDVNEHTSISKELFLIVIQEPEVQRLMDQLDIPPDRASLFDSIDADGSGSLHASELVMGLLKVRGEVKKSDQVACILAIRAVQTTLREMDAAVKVNYKMLEQLSGAIRRTPSKERRSNPSGML